MVHTNKTMKVKSGAILGMTESYNSNSLPQLAYIQSSIPFIEKAIDVLDIIPSSFPIIIADFGSSQGSNSMYAMQTIINYIKQSKQTDRSILVIHNDLPTNNWTSLFNILNEDKTYFGLANGRSFYEQCFPFNSVTVRYSSTSIHWLSCKPCNISNHCVSLFAQGEELAAFKAQSQLDYNHFLENRSRELIQGGVLILTILSVNEQDETSLQNTCDLLYKCAKLLPLNEQELLDYTIPSYFRSYKECLDEELFKQHSFQLIKSDFRCVASKFYEEFLEGQMTAEKFAQAYTDFVRCWSESSLKQTLEMNEKRSKEDVDQLLNQFWSIYNEQVKGRPKEYSAGVSKIYLVLKKL